jgi:hypothetical protein
VRGSATSPRSLAQVIGGLGRGQWRRGSRWRIGLCDLDLDRLELTPIGDGEPVVGPETLVDSGADLTADPWLARHDGAWWLFYEVAPGRRGRGEIHVSTSEDLRVWDHLGPALTADHHLSYPSLTVIDGTPRLVVESATDGAVRFFVPRAFPTAWDEGGTMLLGAPFADPTILNHGGTWWLFVEVSGGSHDRLHVYRCEHDDWRVWEPHPMNPICTDPARARPAGGVVQHSDGRLLRFGQDNAPDAEGRTVYGRRVMVSEITLLTETAYRETPLGPVRFAAATPAWASQRSHHVSVAVTSSGRHVAAVDGRGYPTLRQAFRGYRVRRATGTQGES